MAELGFDPDKFDSGGSKLKLFVIMFSCLLDRQSSLVLTIINPSLQNGRSIHFTRLPFIQKRNIRDAADHKNP